MILAFCNSDLYSLGFTGLIIVVVGSKEEPCPGLGAGGGVSGETRWVKYLEGLPIFRTCSLPRNLFPALSLGVGPSLVTLGSLLTPHSRPPGHQRSDSTGAALFTGVGLGEPLSLTLRQLSLRQAAGTPARSGPASSGFLGPALVGR